MATSRLNALLSLMMGCSEAKKTVSIMGRITMFRPFRHSRRIMVNANISSIAGRLQFFGMVLPLWFKWAAPDHPAFAGRDVTEAGT